MDYSDNPMRPLKIFFSILLALSLSFCMDAQKATTTSEKDTQKLHEAIAAFNEAFQQGNLAVLDSLTTANYMHSNGISKSIDKRSWFTYLKKRAKAIESGDLEVIDYTMSESEIKVYGDMAIVTGKIEVTQKVSGAMQKNAYRVTHVWIHREGRWKRAGFHDGKIL